MRDHGGDWAGFFERRGREPLDFSASVSPLGMPGGARAAAAESLARGARYPDPACRALRRALADRYGLTPGQILCGAGAAELIDRLALALAPRRALITAPAFGEYRAALERTGCRVEAAPLSEAADFRPGDDLLDRIVPGVDLVILCEPNNPTGIAAGRAFLQAAADRCDAAGAWLAVDECFLEFLEDPAAHTMLPYLPQHRLLVLRAFTKFYGMAGLRLGWCACADGGLLERMRLAGQPWSVSLPAQAAGPAALADGTYALRLRALIGRERPRLAAALAELGCRVIPGQANFLLFYDPCPALAEGLEDRGILIRDCRAFEGLGPGWYRTAVREPAENDALIRAVEEVHTWQSGS